MQTKTSPTQTATASQNSVIENGDVVLNYGYEFQVTEVDGGKTINALGQNVWYFTGICTDAKQNNSIRRTSYNGGRYSWRAGENLKKAATF